MRPQFFGNTSRGDFKEVSATSLGEYFQSERLGRAVARVDWDGNGLDEAVISHLDTPVALLQNVTETHGGFVSVRLRGVQSNRDAIGAIVSIQLSDRTVTRQLMAGDGFQASNQRILNFGTGISDTVSQLTIRWPSGESNRFGPLKVNTHWIAVEGARSLYAVSHSVAPSVNVPLDVPRLED